jgi:hypothetical protein
MSMFGTNLPQEAPRVTAWNTVASYASYVEAQAAVDRLVVAKFNVQDLEIVGSGLRTVERVTGPRNWNGTVLNGAVGGAWVGLFVGLLIGLFRTGAAWGGLMFAGLCIGAAWGSLLAIGARWSTRGNHGYSSLSGIVATKYDVIALDQTADQARAALGL